MYPVLSAVLSISIFSTTMTECVKKRAKKTPRAKKRAKKAPPVLKQAKPEEPMDQKPQPNVPPLLIQFKLLYNILTFSDRRELCHLRNVNRRHYIVIERKFGTTPPYLVFDEQCLSRYSWKWGMPLEKMPSDVRVQLSTSKFVRFKSSKLMVHNPSESNIDVLSLSHLWENQKLTLNCASNFVWYEEFANMAAKAKYLELEAVGLIPCLFIAQYLEILDGQGSLSYLRQLTKGNCVRLSITNWPQSLDSFTLVTIEIPWQHILDFLFKPNPKDAKCIVFRTNNPFNQYKVEILHFLQQVKQKFLDSLDSVRFTFAWESFPDRNTFTFDGSDFDDFIVQNRRTHQRLRFRLTVQEFRLVAEDE